MGGRRACPNVEEQWRNRVSSSALDQAFTRFFVVADDPRQVVKSANQVSHHCANYPLFVLRGGRYSLLQIQLLLPHIFKLLLAFDPGLSPFLGYDSLDR